MHFDPKPRRLILALALVELAIVGTMITAVTWRSESMTASAAPLPEGGRKPLATPHQAVKVGAAPHVEIDAPGFAVEIETGNEHRVVFDDVSRQTGVAENVAIEGGDAKLELRASNGKIEFTGRLAPGGDYAVEGSNGSVNVTLPSDSDTTVTASASNGSVHASGGISVTEDGDNTITKYGDGRGALSVSTSNGSVYLSRTGRV